MNKILCWSTFSVSQFTWNCKAIKKAIISSYIGIIFAQVPTSKFQFSVVIFHVFDLDISNVAKFSALNF